MKKSLSLLTLSLLLVVAMILGVSAAVTADDIGVYIRFDNQAAVDEYTGNASPYARFAFDAERGALRLTSTINENEAAGNDVTAWLYFGGEFNVNDYPYFRMSYEIPSVGVNGKTVSTDGNVYGIHVFYKKGAEDVYNFEGLGEHSAANHDTKKYFIKDLREYDTDVTISKFRTDMPNMAYAGEYYEYLIYDIALFKTVEAAYTYNPGLEYYVYDMTSPTEYENWSTTQATMTYNAELGATVFTHDRWIKAEHINPETGEEQGADARVYLKNPVPYEKWHSVQSYPVVAWCYKSNVEDIVPYGIDIHKIISEDGKTVTDGGLGSGIGDGTFTSFDAVVDFEDGWKLGYRDVSSKTAGLTTIVTHNMDPLNVGEAEGTEYVAFKYIAYFKNAEAAAKGIRPEPANLAVVPATAVDGKAAITGVDSTMEYTTDLTTGVYTAVEGDTIAADPGKTYYVRYAETETANASNPVTVGVPHYFKLKINSVKNAKGVAIDAEVEYTEDGIVINAPFGTNTKALMLDWAVETSAPTEGRTAPVLYMNGDLHTSKTAIYTNQAADLSAAAENDGITLTLYCFQALCEYVDLKINVVGADASDAEKAQMILDSVLEATVDSYDFMGTADDEAALAAIVDAADLAAFRESFADAEIDAVVTAFTAATKGTAADVDGTDGSVTYKFTVTYGEATVESDPVELAVPAQHFRYLWKFNDQEFADVWAYSGPNVTKTERGKLPVITENGETFARITVNGDNSGGIYLEYKVADYGSVYNGNEYNYFFKAEDYPYTLIYYRSNGTLPKVDSGEGAIHLYYSTSDIAKGNDYDYAKVPEGMQPNPEYPENLDLTVNPGGAYLGYQWAKNRGIWQATTTAFPRNTQDWTSTIIANNGGTAGVAYASNGYRELNGIANYTAHDVKYPWSGDVFDFRIDPLKVDTVTEGTMDIMAIAFFSTLEDAQNFDLSAINPITANEKTAVDALTIEAADGALIAGEDAVFADAKAKIEAQLTGFDSVTVEKVSYTAMNSENGTDGSVTVKVTVAKGDQLGDRDVYSFIKTMAVTAPEFTVAAAVEAVKKVEIANAASLYTEAAAKAYVMNALAGVIETYDSYEFNLIDATYVAPVDGASDGSYTFYVQVYDGTNEALTEEISFVITQAAAPYIMNFDNEVMFTNAFLPMGNHNDGSLATSFIDIDNGKGLYIERIKQSSEFNFYIYPGRNGMDTVEDLGEYSVIAYRYRLSNGDPTKSLQVYYFTDLYETGYAYQNESTSQDGSDITGEWVNRYFTVRNPGYDALGNCENTAWDGVLESIRFDFMRQTNNAGQWAEIDYVALFANQNQADAFMANPYKNGSEEALAEYDAVLAQVNALDATLPAANMKAFDLDDDLTHVSWAELDALINNYIASLELGVDAYYAITEFTTGKCGTEANPEATDGVVKFKIAFADGGVQNGYVVTSQEFTMEILGADYSAGEEVDGVTYTVDADTKYASIVSVTDAESIVIPNKVTIGDVDYTVTSIAADAFAGMTAAEIRLPNTITEEVELTGYTGYVFVQLNTPTAVSVKGDGVKFKGDYNDNDEVTIADAIGVLQSIAKGSFANDYQPLASNVVRDDNINLSDAIRLLQWIAANDRVTLD